MHNKIETENISIELGQNATLTPTAKATAAMTTPTTKTRIMAEATK